MINTRNVSHEPKKLQRNYINKSDENECVHKRTSMTVKGLIHAGDSTPEISRDFV